MVRINIAVLKEGVHELELTPTAEDLALNPEEFGDIRVKVRLDYRNRRIYVTLETRATANLECDRTLQRFDQEVTGTYKLLFASPEFAGQTGEEYEEVRPFVPEEREIDLTDVVRDTLLLSLPLRRVAPGAEEIELPLQFGGEESEEETTDPRWAALLKLKDQEKSQNNPSNE